MEKKKIYIIVALVVGFILLFIQLPIGLLIFIGLGIYGVVQIVKNRKKKPEEKKLKLKKAKVLKLKLFRRLNAHATPVAKYGIMESRTSFKTSALPWEIVARQACVAEVAFQPFLYRTKK